MMLDKPTLRRQLLARRKELSVTEWQARSATISARVQTYCASLSLKAVALYAPIVTRREVDVTALDGWFRARGVVVAYPIMTSTRRGFTFVTTGTMTNSGGFLQPPESAVLLHPGELDLIVVPALGVTNSGYRLGYGAGFYDQQLPEFCPPATSLCVAFAEQLLSELPLESHDVPCDLVLTDR